MRRLPAPYYRPESLLDALTLWQRLPNAQFMAGGTLLMAGEGPGEAPLIDLLDLPEIQAFSPVTLPGGRAGWRFGAGVTWAMMAAADLPKGLALWRTVARGFVSTAVRAVATLGGSLQAVAGDARLALMVCGGTVTYFTRDGVEQTAPAAPADALVLHLDVPIPDWSAWAAIGARGARRDRAGLALWQAGGRCANLRLARRIGLAPPERLTAVEAACSAADLASLPARLTAAANGCPLLTLLARQGATDRP